VLLLDDSDTTHAVPRRMVVGIAATALRSTASYRTKTAGFGAACAFICVSACPTAGFR